MKRRLLLVLVALTFCLYPMTGRAQWTSDGVLVSGALNNQTAPQSLSDGAGGVFIVWSDTRSGDSDIFAHRITGQGLAPWAPPQNGESIRVALNDQTDPRIVSDGAGGAIIAWVEGRNNGSTDIYAQRIDASGTPLWGINPIIVCGAQRDQKFISAIPDGSGGAIITWQDPRDGSDATADIYAQRINSGGGAAWTSDGVAVCVAADQQSNPVVVSDGVSGAIIAWADRRSGTNRDIYARRVTSAGALQWTADGNLVCTAASEQDSPAMTSDDAGGAIIAWTDARDGFTDIYMQRMNSAGATQWTANGIKICGAGFAQLDPQIISDTSGGAIVVWSDARNNGTTGDDTYAQRVNASGAAQWTADGIVVCNAANQQVLARMAPNGSGGAVVAWMDTRSGGLNYDIYAQRINANGSAQWAANGVALCTAANAQASPTVASDGFGGAIVAWHDFRNGIHNDIYAARVTQGGAILTAVRDTPALSSLRVSDAYPNPFTSGTAFDVTLDADANVSVEIFDVSGRRVRALELGRLVAGATRIAFDGLDARAQRLPSGVYFARVRAAGETATRKLVVQH